MIRSITDQDIVDDTHIRRGRNFIGCSITGERLVEIDFQCRDISAIQLSRSAQSRITSKSRAILSDDLGKTSLKQRIHTLQINLLFRSNILRIKTCLHSLTTNSNRLKIKIAEQYNDDNWH